MAIMQDDKMISVDIVHTDSGLLGGKPPEYYAASGINLLDNWDFRNPVNQRAKAVYPSGRSHIYTVDRWYCGVYGDVAIQTDCVVWSPSGSGQTFIQLIENPQVYIGKTLTVSGIAKASSENIMHIRIEAMDANDVRLGYGASHSFSSTDFTLQYTTLTIPAGTAKIYVRYAYTGTVASDTLEIRQTKLEKGTMSTLLNDPPANYGVELAKCQRYQLEINQSKSNYFAVSGLGGTVDAKTIRVSISIPVTMRVNPVAHISGQWEIKDKHFVSRGIVTGASVYYSSATQISLTCGSDTALDQNEMYYLHASGSNNSTLLFDANL